MTGQRGGVYRAQLAGYPDVYRVRDQAAEAFGEREALIQRAGGGGWQVMYGLDPVAGVWRGDVILPGVDVDQAAAYAVEVVDAAALGVPGYAELLAAAIGAHPLAAAVVRLHRPAYDEVYGLHCTGDRSDDRLADVSDWVAWPCRTSVLAAERLGVVLPGGAPRLRLV